MQQEFSYVSYRTTKSRLLNHLRPFDKREFRKLINEIISSNRGIKISEARQVKYLKSSEVVIFLDKIGEPLEHYGKSVTFKGTTMTKYQLFSKIPFISSNTLRRKIIQIMMENRNLPFELARFQKILYPNEVRLLFAELGETVPTFQ